MASRIALVTGGTKGLGLVTARRLAADGMKVFVCGRSEPSSPLEGLEFIACDVRDPASVQTMVQTIREKAGPVTVLVNNAGGSPHSDAAIASPRFAEKIVGLNLMAPLWASQAVYEGMAERGGSIINIASVSAVRPSPGTSVYAAAKGGLLSLTQSLANEWGPHIRVNAIIVGYIETENTEATYGDGDAQKRIGENIGLKRLGKAQEVAEVVAFLASDKSSYVSGAKIEVHGGGERPPFLDIAQGK